MADVKPSSRLSCSPTPTFDPRFPFRDFDLPIEIRSRILDPLLAPGHVALSPCVKAGFPAWNHERPTWKLLQVSHRMQDEAKATLCSRKNMFYLPLG